MMPMPTRLAFWFFNLKVFSCFELFIVDVNCDICLSQVDFAVDYSVLVLPLWTSSVLRLLRYLSRIEYDQDGRGREGEVRQKNVVRLPKLSTTTPDSSQLFECPDKASKSSWNDGSQASPQSAGTTSNQNILGQDNLGRFRASESELICFVSAQRNHS